MIVVELAGAPGAGKTTLLPAVVGALEAAGLRAYTVEQASRAAAGRIRVVRVTQRLVPAVGPRLEWPAYRAASAVAAVRFFLGSPALVRYLLRTQWRRPAAADAQRRRVLYWFVRMAGDFCWLRDKGRPTDVLVMDEGFTHRVVQLRTSAVEDPHGDDIARYLELVPAADLLITVHAPVEVCRRRVRSRGVWAAWGHRSTEEIDRYVANAHRAVALATAEARARGRAVVDVDNDDDRPTSGRRLTNRLAPVLPTLTPVHEIDSGRPRIWIPRPARIAGHVSARRGPAVIAVADCDAILRDYGFATDGPQRNLAFGARNATVVLPTTAGRKVLRRYRPTPGAASIRHEHAVLGELARVGFPAVRVVPTAAGETFVTHAGHRYAVFDHVDGANLSSCFLWPSDRARALASAGRQLARMHRVLADFEPPDNHHLGPGALAGDPSVALDWYLGALGSMPSPEPGWDPRNRREHAALLQRRDEIGARLKALADELGNAGLRRSMIHGDYGIHNLLFRDGDVVVLDFELARREWRLVDLAIVGMRTPDERRRAFFTGYRREAEVPDSEWRLLPAVWEYQLLTGAVRSWRNHVAFGGRQRLVTAATRLQRAATAREEVVALCR